VVGDLGTLMNADNVDNFLAAQGFYNGTFAYSVPAGTYSLASYIGTSYADNSIDFTLAAEPEVRVTRDTTVVLDARRGKRLSADVGAPAAQVSAQLNLQRNPATGVSLHRLVRLVRSDGVVRDADLARTYRPAVLLPGIASRWRRRRRTAAALRPGVPERRRHPVDAEPADQPGQFATIDARYHSAVPGRSEFEAREAQLPWQAVQVFAANEVVAPDTRTEHTLAVPGMRWLQQVLLDGPDSLGMSSDIVRYYQPGQHTSADWAAQPVAPASSRKPRVGRPAPRAAPATVST